MKPFAEGFAVFFAKWPQGDWRPISELPLFSPAVVERMGMRHNEFE